MKRNLGLLKSLLAVSSLACAALASAQVYALTDVGVLPGGAESLGEGVNDLGNVVGTCLDAAGNPYGRGGFVYRAGRLESVGSLDAKSIYTMAHAINAAGIVVGEGDTGKGLPQAVVYKNGRLTNVDPNNGANVRAVFVSAGGAIVGDLTKSGSGNVSSWQPTIWTDDGRGRYRGVALPGYPFGDPAARYVYANAANNRLQVVGQLQSSLFGGRGAFWEADAGHTLSVLAALPGHQGSYATAVNNLGNAVGISYGGSSTPVVWEAGPGHPVSALPLLPGDASGGASGINDAGDVVGSSGARCVLWRGGIPIDLQAALDASGDGYTLTAVAGINASGQIVGTATRGGLRRAVLLSPVG